MLPGKPGATVRSVLSGQLQMNEESLCRGVRAIFLDGKTVAQLDAAHLKTGSTLALSAVLTEPFLLRAYGDTHTRVARPYEKEESLTGQVYSMKHFFYLKLFNLMLDELGPTILSSGVWIEARRFERFLAERPERFWEELQTAMVDDVATTVETFRLFPWSQVTGTVALTIQEAQRQF
ncbi:MAG: hypothetical protein ACOY58_05935 [Candidatus Micrarchaeota archaeon]